MRHDRLVCPCHGFTLLEMLVAMALLAIAMTITFSTFFAVTKAWERGTALADDLNHGEFITEQLVSGLRSSFFPGSAEDNNAYGFVLEDNGDDEDARDQISWVKTGPALLSPKNLMKTGPHRVRVSLEYDEDDSLSIASRAWRPNPGSILFNPDTVEPYFVCGMVRGLNCRVATNMTDEGWEWEESWEGSATNHLPKAVEITLYMDPLEEDDDPVAIKRLVEIPVADLSWYPSRGQIGAAAQEQEPPQQQQPSQPAQQEPQQPPQNPQTPPGQQMPPRKVRP